MEIQTLRNAVGLRMWCTETADLPKAIKSLMEMANQKGITPNTISFEFSESVEQWHIILWGDM